MLIRQRTNMSTRWMAGYQALLHSSQANRALRRVSGIDGLKSWNRASRNERFRA
jgi:hypothetical protein